MAFTHITQAMEVGMPVEHLLLGSQIEAMSDDELAVAVAASSVFARLAPARKERIIRALQSRDHVVGFMGDGINDARCSRLPMTNRIPFIESRASWQLIATSLIIVAVGALLTVSPLADTLGFALPPLYWLLLAIMLLCYMILTQMVKTWFIRKFGE